jgi:hypothetical protein
MGPNRRAQERERAAARAAAEAKRAVADCRMEPKYGLANIYFRKRLVVWRKGHGPGQNSAASFHVCDCLAGSFLRFDRRRAQLVGLGPDHCGSPGVGSKPL